MDGKLLSVKGLINLPPAQVLDRAEDLLDGQGYRTASRTDTALTVNRRKRVGWFRRSVLHLTVLVEPQPHGGVVIGVEGNDREGVLERQAEWTRWAESLPKTLASHESEAEKDLTGAQPEASAQKVKEPGGSVGSTAVSRGAVSRPRGRSEKQEEVEENDQRPSGLDEARAETESLKSATDNRPTKEDREQLLARTEKLERKVARLDSVWDEVWRPTTRELGKVNASRAPAKRLLAKVKRAAKASAAGKGFDDSGWLAEITSSVEELDAKIDDLFGKGERRREEQEEARRRWEQEEARLKEIREQLLAEVGELRRGVERLNAEWELAQQGRAEPFVSAQSLTKHQAEDWAWAPSPSGEARPTQVSDEKYLKVWLKEYKGSRFSASTSKPSIQSLNERLTFTKKINKEIERCLEARRHQSLLRDQSSNPDWWAKTASGQPYRLKKLRQQAKKLQASVEDLSGHSHIPYHPLFDDAPDAGLAKDPSAKLVALEDANSPRIRFECDELQKKLRTGVDVFGLLKQMQQFEPLQVTVKGSVEWWWFQDEFYKASFEVDQPSAQLAESLAVGGIFTPKESLDGFSNVGRSPEEAVEGVFKTRGESEDDFARAYRADMARAVREQWRCVLYEDRRLDAQEFPQGDDLRRDLDAKLCTRNDGTSTQVCFESGVHRPALALSIGEGQLAFASKLQKHHPLLVTKLVGRGRPHSSESVAEWWWFRDHFYVAKRERDHRSDALVGILEQEISSRTGEAMRPILGWANAQIPKLCVGVVENVYEEGFAPEEIARLAFASQGQREKIGEKFDRSQAAKDLLRRSPFHKQLWEEEVDAYHRKHYVQYLEAKLRGYRATYTRWMVEQKKESAGELPFPTPGNSEILGREDGNPEAQSEAVEEILRVDRALERVNYMGGLEFERFMADLLGRSGYTLESTKLSGDQGVDILLDINGRKMAVQLKRYTRPVGNKAVQEVLAGRIHYRADEAWIITTSSFTKSAVELARSTSVRLIDGRELREWLIELKGG